jgi:hypothetical protein
MRIARKQNDPSGSTRMSVASTYNETVLAVIDREYGRIRNGAKILARHAKSSLPAAQHWIYGRRVPTGENLLNLMANCEALAVALNQEVENRRAQEGI